MAVQRRVNVISQQRFDVPDMRAIESAASNDFDQLIQAFATGTGQGYILRGFEILMSGAIGGAASGLQMLVDPGAVMHIASSQSGTTFMVPTGTPPQQLNSATNNIVQGAFAPSAVNYVGLDYTRFLDASTAAEVYLWDPTANDETTTIAPRAQVLTYNLFITTTVWAANVLPIAIVLTDAGNNVVSITDCRWNFYSLGTGGASPNPFFRYPWTAQSEGRTPGPSTSNSNSVDPFHGGDKMLGSLKDWMNAVMTTFLEIKGGIYWTSPSSSGSLQSLREDLGNTILTGNSNIAHGVLPNSVPVLTTTGNTNSSNQLTNLGSVTGIVDGQVVLGSGIPTGTTVLGVSGTTVTLSQAATSTATGVTVSFYTANVVTQPGQINWASNPPGNGEIYLRLVGSRLSYEIAENPSGASVVLSDNQVAYINLNRGISVIPNLVFTPNAGPDTTTVASVGGISWTGPLQAGDFIKQASDTDAFYYQIFSVDSLTQVTLSGQYVIAGMTASGVPSVYAFGVYTLPGQTGTIRDMVIANRESVPMGQDVVWMFLRSDDAGSVPRVYIKFLGAELQQGDSQEISGPTLSNVLQYIGSPSESATLPNYTSAINPGALPEISSITVPASSAMTAGQYLLINSAGDFRQAYVWVKKDGVGTDPLPPNTNDGIVWNIVTGGTAAQNANLLAVALNSATPQDFLAEQQVSPTNEIIVTNMSAGTTSATSNFDIGGLTVATIQAGTGIANAVVNDGDNLTLAIKKLDQAIANIILGAKAPSYDETVTVVVSGATPPTSINGPISSGTSVTLPNNTRFGNLPQTYTVGKGTLEVFLNGQFINLGTDWAEVGSTGAQSSSIQILQDLVVGDVLTFRINAGSGGGGGGGGGSQGPAGPQGPPGPPGANAAGGPIAISTKIANYSVMLSDNFLKADCSVNSAAITFSLPSAASSTGRIFYFKKIDSSAFAMIILANGSDLIDGLSSQSTTVQYFSFTVISDGTTWSLY